MIIDGIELEVGDKVDLRNQPEQIIGKKLFVLFTKHKKTSLNGIYEVKSIKMSRDNEY